MDGKFAVTEAAKEGFRSNIVIFLDQEEGGGVLPEQLSYILACGRGMTIVWLFWLAKPV